MLILAIDAGFRIKNQDHKTNIDPALGDGWGHFVPQALYQEYIKKYGHQEEVHSILNPIVKKLMRILAKYL